MNLRTQTDGNNVKQKLIAQIANHSSKQIVIKWKSESFVYHVLVKPYKNQLKYSYCSTYNVFNKWF